MLRQNSIVGSTLTRRMLATVDVGGQRAVVAQVSGVAYRIGEHQLIVDPHDRMTPGFVLQ